MFVNLRRFNFVNIKFKKSDGSLVGFDIPDFMYV